MMTDWHVFCHYEIPQSFQKILWRFCTLLKSTYFLKVRSSVNTSFYKLTLLYIEASKFAVGVSETSNIRFSTQKTKLRFCLILWNKIRTYEGKHIFHHIEVYICGFVINDMQPCSLRPIKWSTYTFVHGM